MKLLRQWWESYSAAVQAMGFAQTAELIIGLLLLGSVWLIFLCLSYRLDVILNSLSTAQPAP